MNKDSSAIGCFVGLAVVHVVKPVKVCGKVVKEGERRDVQLMAFADGYAMVRRKGCCPYVVSAKELEPK